MILKLKLLLLSLTALSFAGCVDGTGIGYGHIARSGFRNRGDKYERYLKEKLINLLVQLRKNAAWRLTDGPINN